jgi:hypothetical protein
MRCVNYPLEASVRILIGQQELDLLLVDRAAELMYHLLTVPNSENLPNCLQEDGFGTVDSQILE